ncbi:MAG: sulfurtransferase TusA family protein [Alphaproteobacteria bacterium]|nr:sulfurtransferase TusA family protein [Alphaproteobacteria bacterium]
MPAPPDYDVMLDASGLRCPMPVLRAQKLLRGMETGQVLKILSTDRVSWAEFPAFCEQTGHALVLKTQQSPELWHYYVRKTI